MESPTLKVDGVALLSAEQGHELAYEVPEGAELPSVMTRFLGGREVGKEELAEALVETRILCSENERALELLNLAETRLAAA